MCVRKIIYNICVYVYIYTLASNISCVFVTLKYNPGSDCIHGHPPKLYQYIDIYNIPAEPHEAVPEVSKGKVHITQNKHVPIEWVVTTASQSRI